MKNFFLIAFLLSIFGLSATAQDQPTWTELKQIQETERRDLESRQRSELRALLQIQSQTLEAGRGNGLNFPDTAKGHAQERDRLSQRHTDERKSMTAEHAAERKAFNQRTQDRSSVHLR